MATSRQIKVWFTACFETILVVPNSERVIAALDQIKVPTSNDVAYVAGSISHTLVRDNETGQDLNEEAIYSNVWADIPEFPRKDWQYEVANNSTNLGYADWVADRREQKET